MRVTRHPSAASFLRRAEEWLMRAEVENNLLIGIAKTVEVPAYVATAQRAESVVGCALRCPPHKLIVTRCEPEAMAALAADTFDLYPDLAAAIGPEPEIHTFAAAWAAISSRRVKPGLRQRLHEIRRIEPLARRANGRLRLAEPADLDVLVPWVNGFQGEIPGIIKEEPAALARWRIKLGQMFVWDDRGLVSMAAWGGKTANGVRVNLVYTPPEFRGRGYATACVAALTEQLLAQGGNKYCCLYTSLANAVSNRVYRRVGYQPVCDFTDLELSQ